MNENIYFASTILSNIGDHSKRLQGWEGNDFPKILPVIIYIHKNKHMNKKKSCHPQTLTLPNCSAIIREPSVQRQFVVTHRCTILQDREKP
jgi:hypothetical protein